MLNMAGRVCLAKLFNASIPTYSMQVFWLLRSIVQQIDQHLRGFIWSRRGAQRGWHLVNWRIVKDI